MRNFIVHFYVKNAFKYFFPFFLTGAVLKLLYSNVAQKYCYILLDLCQFFQILESGELKKYIYILKRKVKKI